MQSDNQDRDIWHGNSFIFFKNKTSGRKDKIKMRPILSVLQNCLVTLGRRLLQEKLIKLPCTGDAKLNF